jgi:hypothetical protein
MTWRSYDYPVIHIITEEGFEVKRVFVRACEGLCEDAQERGHASVAGRYSP